VRRPRTPALPPPPWVAGGPRRDGGGGGAAVAGARRCASRVAARARAPRLTDAPRAARGRRGGAACGRRLPRALPVPGRVRQPRGAGRINRQARPFRPRTRPGFRAPSRAVPARSVYLFARTRAGAREGPLKFVSIVTPQPLARQLSAGGAAPRTAGAASPGGRGGAAPPPSAVVQLRFHPGRTSVALATAAGEIFVVELGTARAANPAPAFEGVAPRAHAPARAMPAQGAGRAGSVTLTCKDVHLGSAITALVRLRVRVPVSWPALRRRAAWPRRRGPRAASGCWAATSAAA